jgi:hypothetical protein
MNDDSTSSSNSATTRQAWNKGKLTGPKPPLRLGHVWSIRARLQLERRARDLALFNLAIEAPFGAIWLSTSIELQRWSGLSRTQALRPCLLRPRQL